MKNLHIFITVIFFLTSCSNSEYSINRFEKFISKVESEYTIYDEDKWDEVNIEFEEYCTQMRTYKSKFNETEQEKVDKIKGRYYSIIAKYEALRLKKKVKSIYNQTEGFLEGLVK